MHERAADLAAAVHDVHEPRGELGLDEKLRQQASGGRRELARLAHLRHAKWIHKLTTKLFSSCSSSVWLKSRGEKAGSLCETY